MKKDGRRHSLRGLGFEKANIQLDVRRGNRLKEYESIKEIPHLVLRARVKACLEADCRACREAIAEITGSTRQQGPLNNTCIRVWESIMSFMDMKQSPLLWSCNPSHERIAERANVGVSTARAAIETLVEFAGLAKKNNLEPNRHWRNNLKKIYTPNVYYFRIPARWYRHLLKGAKLQLTTLLKYLTYRMEVRVAKKHPEFVDKFYITLARVTRNQKVRQLAGAIADDLEAEARHERINSAPKPVVRTELPGILPAAAFLDRRYAGTPVDPRPPTERTWADRPWLDPDSVPWQVTNAGDRFQTAWKRSARLFKQIPPERWDESLQQALYEILEAATKRLTQEVP
jgi:hypothetical protein